MAFASHTLFFALSHLLLLLLLIHESQSCPNSISFDCPDHAYSNGRTSLDFPFTNSSLPDCGVCTLTCANNIQTVINCVGWNPDAHYQALDINPSNHTIVVRYPHLCEAYTYSDASFPETPSVSFSILQGSETVFVCPYENGSPKWNDQQFQICDDDDKHIVYGPYKLPQPPKTLSLPPPECSPKNSSFSIQYNISSQCQRCLNEGGRCYNYIFHGEVYCNHRNKGKKVGNYIARCFILTNQHSVISEQGKHLAVILGTVLPGSAIILALIVYCLVCLHRRHRKNKSDSSTTRSMSFAHIRLDLEVGSINGVTVFSYTELEEATNRFDPAKQLGEGGFGVVYHGTLRDGREVAVKRLYEKSYKRIEQFKNEIRILTDLRHQNLVTLYGCTSRHTRELLLVYEYIPNGTVADHLHGEQAELKLLPWSTRVSISIEIATALSYLHFKDIIHRDVKTNNILLDNSFSVKVADFGLSRLFPADVTHVSTAPQGTPGYVDPEYHQCYHLTDKSDVYSFGVVLIELISSLPAVDVGRHRHEINLSNYAMNRIQSSALSELVDPKLGFETDFKVTRMITLVAELASQCLQHERELRPSMEEVKETLKRIASEDYDALEAEETEMSARTTNTTKPPPPPSGSDDAELLRNNRQPPASPVSVMDKWLNSRHIEGEDDIRGTSSIPLPCVTA